MKKCLQRNVREVIKQDGLKFGQFGILNGSYDNERINDKEFLAHVTENYPPHLKKDLGLNQNVISVFVTDDIEKAFEKIKELNSTKLTEIMRINFSTGYTFFNFKDPDGYWCEMVQFK